MAQGAPLEPSPPGWADVDAASALSCSYTGMRVPGTRARVIGSRACRVQRKPVWRTRQSVAHAVYTAATQRTLHAPLRTCVEDVSDQGGRKARIQAREPLSPHHEGSEPEEALPFRGSCLCCLSSCSACCLYSGKFPLQLQPGLQHVKRICAALSHAGRHARQP